MQINEYHRLNDKDEFPKAPCGLCKGTGDTPDGLLYWDKNRGEFASPDRCPSCNGTGEAAPTQGAFGVYT